MRSFVLAVLGLVCGYVVGIGLALVVGIVGTSLFGEVSGLKFIAIGAAVVCAVAAPTLDARLRRARRAGDGR